MVERLSRRVVFAGIGIGIGMPFFYESETPARFDRVRAPIFAATRFLEIYFRLFFVPGKASVAERVTESHLKRASSH